ncbi:hypothetical protein XY44_003814 [Salmonella enterica subsp. enterica]|nr:hypothetical protein [Salmonella enterica subsp. enterica]
MLINRPECSEDSRKYPDNEDSYKAKHYLSPRSLRSIRARWLSIKCTAR